MKWSRSDVAGFGSALSRGTRYVFRILAQVVSIKLYEPIQWNAIRPAL
jgi:hypothetical protein